VIVGFHFEISDESVREFAAGLTAAADTAEQVGARLLVVDLSAARLRGSSGLTALMDAWRQARERGVEFVVVAEECGTVEDVLILTGAISVLTVRISVDHVFHTEARRREAPSR
jgi:anti-anti-sigma factor